MREAYARAEQGELTRLILSFQGVNMIDSSAIHALHEMVNELRSQVMTIQRALDPTRPWSRVVGLCLAAAARRCACCSDKV